ncbi:MAG: hypothetical protein AWT59_1267 [Candidatus Gallionella acididurans]|uniref:Uncharacterized protein n=1 Tax=Candidatus Gallionella acididurans TaxID=1796491 RepID=A0A139BUF5_9PROT|nr:MAG: hypothetical protein AWT59_1267 [Candidatus Gallionella acididurans]
MVARDGVMAGTGKAGKSSGLVIVTWVSGKEVIGVTVVMTADSGGGGLQPGCGIFIPDRLILTPILIHHRLWL